MQNKNNFKNFNKKLLISIFTTFLLIMTLNVLVDPYNVLNKIILKNFNYYKPEIKRQERLTKILNLKLEKNITTIFCGSSRTDWSLNPEYYEKITNSKASNMAIASGNFNEYKEIIYNAINFQPKLNTILIAVELERFAPIPQPKQITLNKNKNLTFSEFHSVFSSIDTAFSSVSTIIRNLSPKDKKRYAYNGLKLPFYNKKIHNSFEFMIKDYNYVGKNLNNKTINFTELKKLIDDLKEKNIEVILYMPPMHITYLEIIDFNNGWDGIDKFKTELAKVQPFYDFMYVHPINTEEIKPDMKYHFESSHATYLAGKMVLDKIFKNEGTFGKLITAKNVHDHNKTNREKFKEWQKKNPQTKQWVDDILKQNKENK